MIPGRTQSDFSMRERGFRNEVGNAVVEMSLVCALIAVVCVSSSSFVGTETGKVLQSVGYALGLVNESPGRSHPGDGWVNINPTNGTNGGEEM